MVTAALTACTPTTTTASPTKSPTKKPTATPKPTPTATKATDTAKPTSTITAPPATVADGTRLTVSGTATDAGGGAVAGIEISTDNGATWSAATKLTTGQTDETIAGADAGNQYGDYNSLSIYAGKIFPSWTDRRSGGNPGIDWPRLTPRYREELLGVLERRLQEARYLGGDDYTIADIAAYPWTVAADTFLRSVLEEAWADKSATRRWLDEVGSRPAVAKAMAWLVNPLPRSTSCPASTTSWRRSTCSAAVSGSQSAPFGCRNGTPPTVALVQRGIWESPRR